MSKSKTTDLCSKVLVTHWTGIWILSRLQTITCLQKEYTTVNSRVSE